MSPISSDRRSSGTRLSRRIDGAIAEAFDGTALGTEVNLAQFNTSLKSGQTYSVSVSTGRGGGTGLHAAVFARFRIATDHRSVQKTGSFSADLASAVSSWR